MKALRFSAWIILSLSILIFAAGGGGGTGTVSVGLTDSSTDKYSAIYVR